MAVVTRIPGSTYIPKFPNGATGAGNSPFVTEAELAAVRFVDGGAVGDGVADDAPLLNAVLASGRSLVLDPLKTYRIRSALIATTDHTGIYGNNAMMVMDLATFTNADRVQYGATTATMIRAIGRNGIRIQDLRIRPSVQDGGKVRIPITNVTKATGQNVVVTFSGSSIFSNGQRVTLYDITGADEVDASTLAGAANAAEYAIEALNASAGTFQLTGTSAVTLTPYVSGGYIEPKRFLSPIFLSQCNNSTIKNVEMYGFTAGYGIAIESCNGVDIDKPHLHDFWSNYNFDNAAQAQISAIEIDQSTAAGVSSLNIHVHDGRIYNFTKGTVGLHSQDNPVAKRPQTDGVHHAGVDSPTRTVPDGLIVSNMQIDNVDEGIDTFNVGTIVNGCRITNITAHCLKIVKSPRDVIVSNNILGPSARDNILIQSDLISASDDDTKNILLSGNIFKGVNSTEFGSSFQCLAVADFGPDALMRNVVNVVSQGNSYDPGTFGTHAISWECFNPLSTFSSKGDNFIRAGVGGSGGYIDRAAPRRAGIVGISNANPCVITIAANTDPAALISIATEGQIIYLRNTGIPELPDGYYKLGSNRVAQTFELADMNGVDINSTSFGVYAGGGVVSTNGRFMVTDPHNKTIAKLVMRATHNVPALTTFSTLPFQAALWDSRNEVSPADNGLKIQLPGFYRARAQARTSGNTPSDATESTDFRINVSGAGIVERRYFTPRAVQAVTYQAEGIFWADVDDIVTVTVSFTANSGGGGVTFSSDHSMTSLVVEMI